jgi:hypothetical protein
MYSIEGFLLNLHDALQVWCLNYICSLIRVAVSVLRNIHLENLTFIDRCIVIYSYSKTNKMHQILKLFILVKRCTCFRRMELQFHLVPLAAGSSSCLTYACCCMCSLELLMMEGKTVRTRWNCSSISFPLASRWQQLFDICLLLYVQSSAHGDGRKGRPKHVECYAKINNLRNRWYLVGFTIGIYTYCFGHNCSLVSMSARTLQSSNSYLTCKCWLISKPTSCLWNATKLFSNRHYHICFLRWKLGVSNIYFRCSGNVSLQTELLVDLHIYFRS